MFDATSSSVSEGDTTSGICLSVTATSLSCNITITLTSNPGTAGIPFIYAIIIHVKTCKCFLILDESDFDNREYTVILVGGSPFPLTRCVDVDTFEDELLEGDQNFTVSLIDAMPANAVVFSVPSTHVVIIHDNGTSTYT